MQEPDFEKIVKEFRKHKKFWTLNDVSEFFDISKRSVWDMVKRGEIEAIKVGREWKVHYTSIVEYMKKNHSYNID